jgi:hypothetical protein
VRVSNRDREDLALKKVKVAVDFVHFQGTAESTRVRGPVRRFFPVEKKDKPWVKRQINKSSHFKTQK